MVIFTMPKLNKELTPKQYQSLLESCVDGCQKDYCFYKWVIGEMHSHPRLLVQLKCIEIFKWELSSAADRDVGGNEASEKWVTEGYAAAFAEVYDAENSPRRNYKDTIEFVKNNSKK